MTIKKRRIGALAASLLSVFFITVLLLSFRGIPVKAEEISADEKAALEEIFVKGIRSWSPANTSVEIPEEYNVPAESLNAIISDIFSVHSKEFYSMDSRYSYSYENGRVRKVMFRKNPQSAAPDQGEKYHAAIRKALSCVNDDMSDLEKIIALHDWLILNCTYDEENYYNDTIPSVDYTAYGALVNGIAVCDGYTKAYDLLLREAGITTYRVVGEANGPKGWEGHSWNIVKLNGKYYHIDATWDDPDSMAPESVWYNYMLKSDSRMMHDHSGWKATGVTTPKCDDDTFYNMMLWHADGRVVIYGDNCYFGVSESKKGEVKKFSLTGELKVETLASWDIIKKDPGPQSKSCYIFRNGDRLYYNTNTEIRSMAMDGTDDRVEYTPDDTVNFVYQISLQNGKLCYKQTNVKGWQETGITLEEEEPLPNLPVFPDVLKEIKCDAGDTVLWPGESFYVQVQPLYITEVVTWSSSNPSAVTIDQNGRVTAVSEGEAVITVSDVDERVQASFKVNVLPGMQEGEIAGGHMWKFIWRIDADGALTVEGDGEENIYGKYGLAPWLKYRDMITSVKFDVSNLTALNGVLNFCESIKSADLTGLDISGNTDMGNMFKGCVSLEEVTFGAASGSGLDINMEGVFSGCTALEKVEFGTAFSSVSVTNIRDMFNGCKSLKEIDLGAFDVSRVTDMRGMFKGCKSLKKIDFGAFDVSNVADMREMFSGCKKLVKADFGASALGRLTSAEGMFSGCTGLTEVKFGISADGETPETDINMDNMFSDCTALTRAELGTFHTVSMTCMFDGCIKLEEVKFDASFTSGPETSMSEMFHGCTSLTKVDFGESAKKTDDMEYMFTNCKYLKEIDLGAIDLSAVKYMTGMFSGCTRLTKVDFGASAPCQVKKMTSMFKDCTSLKEIELFVSADNGAPETDTDMSSMFEGCAALTRVKLGAVHPVSMSSIFRKCGSLEEADLGGLDLSGLKYTVGCFSDCGKLTSVACPVNMAANITLPSRKGSPWKDENGAEKEKAAAGLAVPMTYTRVINSLPEEPDNTKEPETTEKTTKTEKTKALKIGAGITSKKTGAKYKVTVSGSKPQVAYVACGDTGQKTVDIPAAVIVNGLKYTVTSIADGAFKGNKKLTKVTIPGAVTAIGNSAFEGCKALKSIVIPSYVKSIGKSAFKNCKKLRTIQVKGCLLSRIGKNAFKGIHAKAKIKVPKKQFKTYKRLLKGKGQKKTVKIIR